MTATRPSSRAQRKRKVAERVRKIDETSLAEARLRRLDALENDNYAAELEAEALAGDDEYDPEANSDEELKVGGGGASKKRSAKRLRRGAAARAAKPVKKGSKKGIERWNKSFAQALEEEDVTERPEGMVRYDEIEARPSVKPPRPFCSVCGFHAAYTCTRCFVRFCSVPCGNLHNDTRCLKYTT